MRTPNQRRVSDIGINMTPMIDVVFLLIIFFLVSSHLGRQEARTAMRLPAAFTGNAEATEGPVLTINVTSDGTVQVHGRDVEASLLRDVCREYANRFGADALVRVRGERTTPYRYIGTVLRSVAESGLNQVAVAVVREVTR